MEQPHTPARIMGLDIGDRRIGIAISDGLGLTAQPLFTLHRTSSSREDVRSIARMVRKHAVAEIVVGLPLHISGEESPQAVKTRKFAQELAERVQLPMHFLDERLTSHAVDELMKQGGRNSHERKALVDQMAAALILQGFLDERASSGSPSSPVTGPG
ncbi:MAG: Holliday junction resolvase RuvX [Acidobacteria bacterium]|nr:Holliday junction resolvase RuvX [Acidobacteriota bacterium]